MTSPKREPSIRERETTPAPSNPFARPTFVPAAPRIPLELAVPVRIDGELPHGMAHRLFFVLAHVDGHSTVGEIVATTQLDFEEVLAAFLELLAFGLVDLTERPANTPTPTSVTRPKT